VDPQRGLLGHHAAGEEGRRRGAEDRHELCFEPLDRAALTV
jgi:hypothetical protein